MSRENTKSEIHWYYLAVIVVANVANIVHSRIEQNMNTYYTLRYFDRCYITTSNCLAYDTFKW